MTTALTSDQYNSVIPVYAATFTTASNGDVERHFTPNKTKPEDRTCLKIFTDINNTTKGAADSFALIGRSTKLITPYLPEDIADWTGHVSEAVLKARSALSIVNLPRVWKAFLDKMTFRTTCDLLATSFYALAIFVRDVVSKTIASIGALFKTLIDCNDFIDTFKKFCVTRELCNIAEAEGASDEVKKGLNSLWCEQLLSIGKYFLAAIAGLVTGFVFLSGGMVLPLAVGVSILAATVASSILSITVQYVRESADFVEFKA